MAEAIRTWPDALFYLSSAGSANVREQLIKLQQSTKRIRALSDAATVNTNGDVLQDILTGLSLGDSSQRHKYRVLYDTLNDRFLVQRNSGTDAAKVWVELLRLDASGNMTVTGNFSQDLIETDTGEVVLGSTLNLNDFYIRNVDKNIGQFRTDRLLVHDDATINDATITTLNVPAASGFQIGSNDTKPLLYSYAVNSVNQSITGTVETDVTSLTGVSLPNTSAVNTRSYKVEFALTVLDVSGASQAIAAKLYNGPDGDLGDTAVYQSGGVSVNAFKPGVISGLFKLTPGASDRTKVGLTVTSDADCLIFGESNIFATLLVTELT